MDKINQLLKKSKEVLRKSSLDNGAIVSAHKDYQHFPELLRDQHTVSIRDASYACIAADLLHIENIQKKFFDWCLKRNVDIRKNGTIHTQYSTTGARLQQGLQPDANGILLYAIWYHFKRNLPAMSHYVPLVKKLADQLVSQWDKTNFKQLTKDVWGEFTAFPQHEENFVYTLAACHRGLLAANEMVPSVKYERTADLMQRQLHKAKHITRSIGKQLADEHTAIINLAAIYPFEIVKPDKRFRVLGRDILKHLHYHGGFMRYQEDMYDGMIAHNMPLNKGAGIWPAMSFVFVTYLLKINKRKHARKYYVSILNKLPDSIPEQLFQDKHKHTAQAHVFSHAWFVLATAQLGYFILEP